MKANSGHWSAVAAVVWICSRDEQRVSGSEQNNQTFLQLIRPYRPRAEGPDLGTQVLSTDVPGVPRHWDMAFDELFAAARAGGISAFGVAGQGTAWTAIPIVDLRAMKPSLVDGSLEIALRPSALEPPTWRHVRFGKADVQRLWPGERDPTVGSKKVERQIYDLLQSKMAHAPMTKGQAVSETKREIPKWSRAAFDRAWKRLDPMLKLAPGKRGKGRTPKQ